jgi:hypothetical protein
VSATTSLDRYRRLPRLTEKQWQAAIVATAKQFSWSVYHTEYSIRSTPGFPDLVLVKPPRVIFAELKTASPNSRVSQHQQAWLDLLGDCDGVETYLWRDGTDDIEDIARILMGEPL